MGSRWIENRERSLPLSEEGQCRAAREFGERHGDKVAMAVEFALEKHGKRMRKDGNLYFSHVIEVGKILNEEWGIEDKETLAAGVLHDVHEDEGVSLEEIRERFGERVSYLVDGVSKYKSKNGEEGSDQDTLRKVAEYSTDVSVLLIKLADRLHNMRTLSSMKRESQIGKAKETLNAYVEMATAIGLWSVKTELEELAYYYLDPERYMKILKMLEEDQRRSPDFVVGMQSRLREELKGIGVEGEVELQFKGCRGADKKRERAAKEGKASPDNMNYVPDIVSFRVILDEKQKRFEGIRSDVLCGMVLRQIAMQMVESGGFKMEVVRTDDYIMEPRVNGYQALHGVFVTMMGQAFEVAVTTKEREEFNRLGILSLMRKGKDLGEYRMLKIVFTPEGKVKFLPQKANGLDVACAIDPRLAMRATGWVGVGVGDEKKLHMLAEVVPHGTQIKITTGVTRSRPGQWLLNLSLPETRHAIEPALGRAERVVAIEKGKGMLESILKDRGFLEIEDLRYLDREMEENNLVEEQNPPLFTLLTTCGCGTVGELCAAVGGGFLPVDRVAEILDDLGVTKELGWSTLLISGSDRPGVLAELAGAFLKADINIVQEMNKVSKGQYEIRVMFKGATQAQLDELRGFLGNADFVQRQELV